MTNAKFETVTSDKCLKMKVRKALDDKLIVALSDEEGSLVNNLFDGGSLGTGAQEVIKEQNTDMVSQNCKLCKCSCVGSTSPNIVSFQKFPELNLTFNQIIYGEASLPQP